MASDPDLWMRFLGRLHPLLLHLPIGAFVLLVVMELAARRSRSAPMARGTRALLCAVVSLAALASSATGWLLAQEQGSAGVVFERHRALAIAFTASLLLASLCAAANRRRAYGILLGVGLLLLLPAGHLGAEMTHGAGFLLEPFAAGGAPDGEAVPSVEQGSSELAREPGRTAPSAYALEIAPILTRRCTRCHGETKRKGGLALHDARALTRPGDSGRPPVVPGEAGASEILRRMRLPLDHDEHMPPPSKSQPTSEELESIERWVASGAPGLFAASPPLASSVDANADARTEAPEPPTAAPVPDPDTIAALRSHLVHVETIDPADGSLWLDFRALSDASSSFVRDGLSPLGAFVLELDLARTSVDDELLADLAGLPRLERLDLSGTACTAAGLESLAGHPELRSLNLTGCAVDDSALDALASLPNLERLHVSHTALSAEGIASLALRLPDARIVGQVLHGEPPLPAEPIEVEPPVRLGPRTGDDGLRPSNTTCPVSGRPVAPTYRIVHEGRVVAFCCADCVTRFWEGAELDVEEGTRER